jgi:hypothetical protein
VNATLIDARDRSHEVHERIDAAVGNGWNDVDLHHQLLAYLSAVASGEFQDLSAAVVDGERLLGFVLANDAHKKLGYFGRPLHFNTENMPRAQRVLVDKMLLAHFSAIAKAANRDLSVVTLGFDQGALSPVAVQMLGQGATLSTNFHAVVDLSHSAADLKSDVRDSYRSLINWGRRNIEIRLVNGGKPDSDLFREFRQFHLHISGRQTRPLESWNEMYNLVTQNKAELVTGFMDGELVSATFTVFSPSFASYATGVYDRLRFDKPISHWPLFLAILNAKQRGCQFYDLGEVFVPAAQEDKKANIAFFKKGFTSRVEPRHVWRLAVTTP